MIPGPGQCIFFQIKGATPVNKGGTKLVFTVPADGAGVDAGLAFKKRLGILINAVIRIFTILF